jgi:cell pole-organizing protein PopZ
MNKAAPKEPSMDEILSSIRQIIADDDAAAEPRRPFQPTVASDNPAPQPVASPEPEVAADEDEPLTLSAAQIVEAPPEEADAVSFDAVMADIEEMPENNPEQIVDPDDISFEASPETDENEAEEAVSFPSLTETEEDEPMAIAEPAAASIPDPVPFPPSRRSVAETAPMPDPTLSSDLAERLLEPTTDAAVRHTFSRITHMPIGNEGLTIEALMRDMLRPMLKEWLDENLPTLVERMVEKEIARVSRGLE